MFFTNSVNLTGRLTKDPELRYIPETQNAVAAFTIAVDRPFSKDKQADFIKITVFGKQAENAERFTAKGKMVGVQGYIKTGSYKNKEGAIVYTTDVIADRVEFLEWRDKDGAEPRREPTIPEGFAMMPDDDEPY